MAQKVQLYRNSRFVIKITGDALAEGENFACIITRDIVKERSIIWGGSTADGSISAVTGGYVVDFPKGLDAFGELVFEIKRYDRTKQYTGKIDIPISVVNNLIGGYSKYQPTQSNGVNGEIANGGSSDESTERSVLVSFCVYQYDVECITEYSNTITFGDSYGVSDHADLTGRSKADQHPTSAITGLDASLSALRGRLTTAEAEIGNNETAIDNLANLVGEIDTELSAVKVDVAGLELELQSEVENRNAQYQAQQMTNTTLNTSINNEVERAQSAEGVLQANITAEQSRAQVVEASLQEQVDDLGVLIDDVDADLAQTKIDVATLNTELATEIENRTTQYQAQQVTNNTLNNAINAEVTRAQSAEYGLEQSKMANTPSGDPMHYMYVEAGGVWNADSQNWSVNGVTCTTAQCRTMYKFYSFNNPTAYFTGSLLPTNFPCFGLNFGAYNASVTLDGLFRGANIPIIALTASATSPIFPRGLAFTFGCSTTISIIGIINLTYITSASSVTLPFYGATALQNVNITNLKVSISIADSPNLSKASILYMITNSSATSAITITLHPTAYAMASADADIQSALTAKPFVSLASA